jgi:hypothetical protein
VQSFDTKPKRRLFDLLTSQGMQANQQITFFSDGADTVRALPEYLHPRAEHILDWFHLTMRLTVLFQCARGLPTPPAWTPILPATRDPSSTTENTISVTVTPHRAAIRKTIAWWRSQQANHVIEQAA